MSSRLLDARRTAKAWLCVLSGVRSAIRCLPRSSGKPQPFTRAAGRQRSDQQQQRQRDHRGDQCEEDQAPRRSHLPHRSLRCFHSSALLFDGRGGDRSKNDGTVNSAKRPGRELAIRRLPTSAAAMASVSWPWSRILSSRDRRQILDCNDTEQPKAQRYCQAFSPVQS